MGKIMDLGSKALISEHILVIISMHAPLCLDRRDGDGKQRRE